MCIRDRCKGGFIVDVESCLCFLPGSQIDLRPLKNFDHLMKVPQTFECVKLDKKRGNIVLSRRAILEKILLRDRNKIISKLKEGDIVSGTIKNLTEWGAFVDLNGVDALLHITDISWRRINKPADLLSNGQSIKAKIIKIEEGTKKISLGVKQLTEDPWLGIENKFPLNTSVMAKVTNLTDYGFFAEIEPGIEGLVHVSEIDWTNKNIHPSKVVQLGESLEVMILDVNEEKRRVSLGLKQLTENPWEIFAHTYKEGDRITGQVKSITDFGVFVGLEGGIDGLVHLSDVSWSEDESELRLLEKSKEIELSLIHI